jgi:hypothetical protein
MASNFNSISPSNLPTKPSATYQSNAFPGDLVGNGRNFATQIQFVQYSSNYATGGTSSTPTGGILLPLPERINDVQTITWEAESATQVAASVASAGANALLNTPLLSAVAPAAGVGLSAVSGIAGAVGNPNSVGGQVLGIAGAYFGITVNPFLWMLFKSPNFKEHQLSWILTPNNEQDSIQLKNIIDSFKYNSLPETDFLIGMKYPCIALVSLLPNDIFGNFKFKPCAVTSVSVDYSAGGVPSFFNNGAPTTVRLSVTLKEIQIWTKNNYNS